ncbi:secretory phospholipase A2 receptor [Elysia marginata]|uniref:Secretory phospholipase A2 receptor n=1 Tax=Elysia marginata TaxID=1093978 RepID=A0AAV4GTA8_9GAST|nr:secretory phospholipase A2 receptor [Elysia marginata]
MYRPACVKNGELLVNMDGHQEECHKGLKKVWEKLNSVNRPPNGPIPEVPHEDKCRLLDRYETCIINNAPNNTACSFEYRELLYRIWPISIDDRAFRKREECHAHCPAGWSAGRPSTYCIKLFHEPKTWREAQHACKDGSSLLKIVDPRTDHFLIDLISKLDNNTAYFWVASNERKLDLAHRWPDGDSQYIPVAPSDLCMTISRFHLRLSNCTDRLGYVCTMPTTNCNSRQISRTLCVERALNYSLWGELDNDMETLADICFKLSQCWDLRNPLCTGASEDQLEKFRESMEKLCSNADWDLIAKDHKECKSDDSYRNLTEKIRKVDEKAIVRDVYTDMCL